MAVVNNSGFRALCERESILLLCNARFVLSPGPKGAHRDVLSDPLFPPRIGQRGQRWLMILVRGRALALGRRLPLACQLLRLGDLVRGHLRFKFGPSPSR
jgi:hypothetical protein